MTIRFRVACVFVFLGVFLATASPIFASSIKADLSASGKGVVDPTCSAATVSTLLQCVSFTNDPGSLPTWTSFSIDQSTNVVSQLGPYNLFVVSTSGGPITFQFASDSDVFGTFTCGPAPDPSNSGALNGFCTDVDEFDGPATFLSLNPDTANALNQATFDFNTGAPGLPATWVFYATANDATISTGNGTSVPEPSSLLLLAAGLALVGLKLRRS